MTSWTLDLPRHWVYVHYSTHSENVANSDTLTTEEAKRYWKDWSKLEPVSRITLETGKGKKLAEYRFDRDGAIIGQIGGDA